MTKPTHPAAGPEFETTEQEPKIYVKATINYGTHTEYGEGYLKQPPTDTNAAVRELAEALVNAQTWLTAFNAVEYAIDLSHVLARHAATIQNAKESDDGL